jgi:hypothetical protein
MELVLYMALASVESEIEAGETSASTQCNCFNGITSLQDFYTDVKYICNETELLDNVLVNALEEHNYDEDEESEDDDKSCPVLVFEMKRSESINNSDSDDDLVPPYWSYPSLGFNSNSDLDNKE